MQCYFTVWTWTSSFTSARLGANRRTAYSCRHCARRHWFWPCRSELCGYWWNPGKSDYSEWHVGLKDSLFIHSLIIFWCSMFIAFIPFHWLVKISKQIVKVIEQLSLILSLFHKIHWNCSINLSNPEKSSKNHIILQDKEGNYIYFILYLIQLSLFLNRCTHIENWIYTGYWRSTVVKNGGIKIYKFSSPFFSNEMGSMIFVSVLQKHIRRHQVKLIALKMNSYFACMPFFHAIIPANSYYVLYMIVP